MLKKFIRTALILVLITFFVIVTLSYVILTENVKNITKSELMKQSEEVLAFIPRHQKESAKLRTLIEQGYIERARAFAEMIKLNPKIIEDTDELNRIRKLINVDELHICDENGILKWGTVPKYYNLDFAASDQTKVFLPGLDDMRFEMVQDPQINAKGIYFQYVTVARYDKSGLVQIGIKPERLDEAMTKVHPSNLLKEMCLSKDKRIIVTDVLDGNIIGDSGGPVKSDAVPVLSFLSQKDNTGFTVVEGIKYYYLHTERNGYNIYNLVTMQKMFAERNMQLAILIASNLLIYSLLFGIVHFVTGKHIIKKDKKE